MLSRNRGSRCNNLCSAREIWESARVCQSSSVPVGVVAEVPLAVIGWEDASCDGRRATLSDVMRGLLTDGILGFLW